ncbi:retrovirus-related Pol polyprotein from transposon 412 [Trichonephila clavipes]|nr:retrovirus-related Pol polyprotein from transposon 412 [Trichonephila clavipes]
MVVDTGANVSIIRKDLARNSQVSIIWTPPCISLQAVTGDTIHVHGKANVTLRPEVQYPRPIFRGSSQGITIKPDLDEKQRCAARGLVKELQSLFSRTSEGFGRTRLTKHRIDTGEHPPIKQHPRILPFAKQEEV